MTNSTTATKIELTFTQCKQLIANGVALEDFLEKLNDQPEFMKFESMGVDSISELQSLIQCGCASNAHRSVYYYEASQCMAKHGDDVLEFIENYLGEIPAPQTGCSWSQLGSNYLSTAIELWCGQFADDLDGVDWD